jgi:hypothetical protein
MNIIRYALLVLTLYSIAACGGGDGAATTTSHTATLKLSTSGTPSANLAGIGITVTLPDGLTPALNSDGSVAATVVTVSGVAAPGTVLAPVYTPASGATKGTLRLVMASSITAGFGAGEFATLTLTAAAGSNPAQTDFTLSDFNPIDVHGASATGLTPAVASLAVQ